jgi:isoleucyl-tRNA synthetase
VLKDRLYAEAPDGSARRAAQFVLARLHDVLTRLLAPVIAHTAEELWDYRPAADGCRSSVHLTEFPEPDARWDDEQSEARWAELIALREQALVALEGLRKEKVIGSAQEAQVRITTARPERWRPDRELLATLCIVSEVEIVADPTAKGEVVQAERSTYAKCERCWNYRPGVGQDAEHPTLCERCVQVINEMNANVE